MGPRSYKKGDEIEVEVQITQHHQGWMEFRLCPMRGHNAQEPELCFDIDDSRLQFADGTNTWDLPDETEGIVPGKDGWWYKKTVKLPDNFECPHCVLQWHWQTATLDNACDKDGCGTGYGDFYGCADISIV